MAPTIRKLRERVSAAAVAMRGTIRRMVAGTIAGKGLWQAVGFEDDEGQETEPDVEVFPGVGFYARPKAGAKDVELIVLSVGGAADHPVIVATRDRSTQLELDADETAIFNSAAQVKIDKNGAVTIRAKAGQTVTLDDGSGAAAVATKADIDALTNAVNALITTYNAHTHPYLPGPGAATPTGTPVATGVPASPAVGTTVLRAK